MTLNDPGKLLVFVVLIVGAFVLMALGRIEATVFVGIVGPILGYITGNGNLARRNESPSPVIVAKPPPGEVLIGHFGPDGRTIAIEPAQDVITADELAQLADEQDTG